MSRPTTIDLRARFGDQYRVTCEASGATRRDWPPEDRAWLWQVCCRYGVVAPFGGSVLQAMVLYHPRIGARLRRLPCILSARGDVETVVTFDAQHIDAVFDLLKPYRRRRLSEKQRVRQAAILRRARERRHALSEQQYSHQEATQRVGAHPGPASWPRGV